MHRPKTIPKYALHKASGHARVVIGGREHFQGKYGTDESWERYRRLIAECVLANNTGTTPGHGRAPDKGGLAVPQQFIKPWPLFRGCGVAVRWRRKPNPWVRSMRPPWSKLFLICRKSLLTWCD